MTKEKDATAQEGIQKLQTLLQETLPTIMASASKKIHIDQIRAYEGSIRDLDIDKVNIGTASIDKIVLNDTQATLHGANATLKNVRIVLQLKFRLKWRVRVLWIRKDGELDLGSMHIGIKVGDVGVPELKNLQMNIPSVTIPEVKANVAPINKLDLNGARLHKLLIQDTELPADGFNLSGMSVGSVSVKNLVVPKTTTAKATVDQFQPIAPVKLPGARITDMKIPKAKVDDIHSGSLAVTAFASRRSIGADLGILKFSLSVEPITHMHVETMEISDVNLSASVRDLNIGEISLPLSVNGITISGLELNPVTINEVNL